MGKLYSPVNGNANVRVISKGHKKEICSRGMEKNSLWYFFPCWVFSSLSFYCFRPKMQNDIFLIFPCFLDFFWSYNLDVIFVS
jgi:hypothetical protein